MAYGNYKSLDEIARQFGINISSDNFVESAPFAVSQNFKDELAFVLRNINVRVSEAAIGEFLIAPILKEIWRNYIEYLLIWSHVALVLGEEFVGFPDYLFTKKTALGMVREKPYLIVVEAKKDDFEAGWAQCAAALLASQQINQDENLILYGIVSNGDGWQFGKFQHKTFVRDTRTFGIADLDELFGALNYIFEKAKEQTASH